jgi:RNase P protein component
MRKLSEIEGNEFTPTAHDIIIPRSSFVDMNTQTFQQHLSKEYENYNIYKIYQDFNKDARKSK